MIEIYLKKELLQELLDIYTLSETVFLGLEKRNEEIEGTETAIRRIFLNSLNEFISNALLFQVIPEAC